MSDRMQNAPKNIIFALSLSNLINKLMMKII